MQSKIHRHAFVLTLAVGVVLAIGWAIAPSPANAFGSQGTWVGNCPAFVVLDTTGLSPVGRCSESNYELGVCRDCALYFFGPGQAKGDCVTTPL